MEHFQFRRANKFGTGGAGGGPKWLRKLNYIAKVSLGIYFQRMPKVLLREAQMREFSGNKLAKILLRCN